MGGNHKFKSPSWGCKRHEPFDVPIGKAHGIEIRPENWPWVCVGRGKSEVLSWKEVGSLVPNIAGHENRGVDFSLVPQETVERWKRYYKPNKKIHEDQDRARHGRVDIYHSNSP